MKRNCLLFAFAVMLATSAAAQGWQMVGAPLPSVGEVLNTVLRFDSAGTAYVCQGDDGIQASGSGLTGKLTVMKYDGTDWLGVGPTGFTPHQAVSSSFVLAPNGAPYVSFDHRDIGYDSALVMKYNGTGWERVGHTTAPRVFYTSIALDRSNTPYLAYGEPINSKIKVTVLKYDGSSWNQLGSRGFSQGDDANMPSITIDGNGMPYVLFAEADSGQSWRRATVMKYNGTDWVTVGTRQFTPDYVQFPTMAIDRRGTPYVVYTKLVNGFQHGPATVMKFDGSNWVILGGAPASPGVASYPTIAIDSGGTPYVAFGDSLNGYKATVVRFDGNNWVNVGNPNFSAGKAFYTCIALDPSGRPFVVYEDYGNAMHATVMKYTGPLDTTHTGISEPITENTFTIRPNPSAGVFRVSFAQQVTHLQVYDVQGRLVIPTCNEMDGNTLTIDLTGKARGIYFFRASTLNGTVNGKLVLE